MLLYILYTLSLDLYRESAPCSRGQRSNQAFQCFLCEMSIFLKVFPLIEYHKLPMKPHTSLCCSLFFLILFLSLSPTIPPSDPSWGSCSVGVFICVQCSGIHRNIPDIGMKVKSLGLSRWEDQEVKVSCSPKSPKTEYSLTYISSNPIGSGFSTILNHFKCFICA